MKKFEIRDPIHSRIPVSENEMKVINHPFVQRLRFISQLSFLQSYVYPGGVHDRFSHVLGAMHVGGRIFGRLVASSNIFSDAFLKKEIDELRSLVRYAGLLHDIGHGPFSHSSESVFPSLSDLPLNNSWWKKKEKRKAEHEDYSVLLVQTMADEGVFTQDFAQDICSLIHGEIRPSSRFRYFEQKVPTLQRVLKSIVSGELDCDRMDYLLRDSYFCGVEYGNYDINWLISSMGLSQINNSLVFTIKENGVRAFEDMLLARYHMIDQVYFHKTKAGFQYYLNQAIKEREIDLQIPSDPYEYVKKRDAGVIELLFQASLNHDNYWSNHLMRRIPAKRILRFNDLNDEDTIQKSKLAKLCEEHDIRHFVHSVKGDLTGLGKIDNSGIIFVEKKQIAGEKLIPIFDYSTLLKQYDGRIRFTDFFVFIEDYERFKKLFK